MNLGDFKDSRYLKKEDCGQRGLLLTIKAVTLEKVGQGPQAKNRPVLHFHEQVTPEGQPIKPMVCNPTNGAIIAQITGADRDIERTWVGAKIVAYHNPLVTYGGVAIGGISVRAPRQQPPQPVQQPRPVAPMPYVPPNDPFPQAQPQQQFVPPDAGYAPSAPAGYDEQGGGMDGDTY